MKRPLSVGMTKLLLRVSFVICVSVKCLTAPAFASTLEFRPSLVISEEVTDNVFEVPGIKRSEFITRLQPGFTSRYQSPIWSWDLGYAFDYRRYERNSRSDETTHNLRANGSIALVDNRLYLDVSDTYRRVSLDVARDVTTESLFVNQTDQNIATVSPYLLWRPTEKSTLKTGYLYTETRYWDSAGIDQSEHRFLADLNHGLTSKLSLSAGYDYARGDTLLGQFDKHDLSGGMRYQYSDTSFIFGSVGNSWQNFANGNNVSNLFWNAGVTHDLGIAVATIEARVQYSEDPLTISTLETSYSGRLDRLLQRGAIGFSSSYSEFINTETDITDRRRLAFTGTGHYEVLPSLTVSLAATAERFSVRSPADFPYRLSAIGGLSYAFNYDIVLGVTYTHVSYLTSLKEFVVVNEVNRVVIEVRKTF